MTNLKSKLATGLATAGLLAGTLTPAAFAVDVEIVDNGALSHNKVNVSASNTVSVSQSNNTTVMTKVAASANTGGNTASLNTGGNVSIMTGDASNAVGVVVMGGSNHATLPENCLCPEGGGTVTIEGNGAFSKNDVKLKLSNKFKAAQSSKTTVGTFAWLKAMTGNNKANFNTNGDVDTQTGHASNEVYVKVVSQDNILN